MRIVETKVLAQGLQREIETLKSRCGAMEEEKERKREEVAQEERRAQEEIVTLLDAVSRYKETIDVGEDGSCEGENETQRLHSFAQECSRE